MSRPLPPALPRRLMTVPLALAALPVLLVTLPLWVVVAAATSPFLPGKLRPLRLLWFAIVWFACEWAALAALGWMWLRAGFGRGLGEPRWQAAHYRLLRWMLERLYASARRTFRLRVVGSGPGHPLPRDRPLLVLCRHAGPGDSLLLIRAMVTLAGRHPRIVLKDTLQLDPTIDVLLNRLPNRFITPRPGAAEDIESAIAELARDAGPQDAVVIFPEGGNFTERRRLRAIERLRRLGHADEAAKAERMRHVLAPKPGGTLAAVAAAPTADVLLVAHEGLEDLSTVADMWRGLPMDDVVEVRWWHVPSEELPRGLDVDAQVDWLFDWWGRLDAWIAEQRVAAGRAPRRVPG
ncbi:MAG TPA: 1-acyl-sn-glycerol-3-phosphate acyltransferase [Mycobacteriales bacterium]|nr:1-acyl-sn-glycerol-3-phosphate acyltransferase [Mycobacteriales bacterium]